MRQNTFQKWGTAQKNEGPSALFIGMGTAWRPRLITAATSARARAPPFLVHFIKTAPLPAKNCFLAKK
jgi:hypothetical protein